MRKSFFCLLGLVLLAAGALYVALPHSVHQGLSISAGASHYVDTLFGDVFAASGLWMLFWDRKFNGPRRRKGGLL